MSDLAIPLWTFPPNWDRGVLERLEWKTDVLRSESGKEQRIPRRLAPKRTLEATFLLHGEMRQRFDYAVATGTTSEMQIPLWYHVTQLQAAAGVGTNALTFDTVYRDYAAGGYVVLRQGDKWAAYQIDSVSDTGLQLISNLAESWPQGTMVYPSSKGLVVENISATKKTSRVAEVTVQLQLTDPAIHDTLWYPPEHKDVSVFDINPNDSEDLTHEYMRNLSIMEGDLAQVSVQDMGGRVDNRRAYRWGFAGRKSYYDLKQTLYYLRGRNRAVWVPSYMQDFTIVEPVSTFDSSIVVANCGYTVSGGATAGRQDIRIILREGLVAYRRITGSSVIDENRELINLEIPLFLEFTPQEVVGVSFMTVSRLDQDTVEIDHVTDTDGVTQCAVTWLGPMDTDPLPELTTKFYPQFFLEEFGAAAGSTTFAELRALLKFYLNWDVAEEEFGNGSPNLSYSQLRQILRSYTFWPVEEFGNGAPTLSYSLLRQILRSYLEYQPESFGNGSPDLSSATLRQILLTYPHWPTESFGSGSASLTLATLV